MERPTRFEHHQWLGDKRNQVVHDVDACTEPDVIDELMEAETYCASGPTRWPRPATAATTAATRCEGVRSAEG